MDKCGSSTGSEVDEWDCFVDTKLGTRMSCASGAVSTTDPTASWCSVSSRVRTCQLVYVTSSWHNAHQGVAEAPRPVRTWQLVEMVQHTLVSWCGQANVDSESADRKDDTEWTTSALVCARCEVHVLRKSVDWVLAVKLVSQLNDQLDERRAVIRLKVTFVVSVTISQFKCAWPWRLT